MKRITKFIAVTFSIFGFFLGGFGSTVFAQRDIEPPGIGVRQPRGTGVIIGNQSADQLLETVIRNGIIAVFTFSSIAVVIYFMWGAVDWILAGGDKDKIAAARKKMTGALIGLTMLALSFAIIAVVGGIVGINVLGGLTVPFLGAGR
jgi:hypothetical protein